MCCFSGPVDRVSSTRIFVRPTEGNRQVVVYQMSLRAPADVAMILPIPSVPDASAFRFIDLEAYPDFFADLDLGWKEYDAPVAGSLSLRGHGPLKVHDVGAFEASFAPRLSDLHRLDARFTIPATTWSHVPGASEGGFAVFKLRNLASQTDKTIHPMAFEYERRNPNCITFPTVHIHDGTYEAAARFDHVLYLQTGVHEDPRMDEPGPGDDFIDDEGPVQTRVDLRRCAGTVAPAMTVYRKIIDEVLPNGDQVLRFDA